MAINPDINSDFCIDNLSFSSINCNSLNMSSCNKLIQQSKVYGVAKLKSDVIFMSDIRLCNRNKVSGLNDLSNIFLTNPYYSYSFMHNSTQNKRGTGILIKSDIPFVELARREDREENFLLVRVEIRGKTLILGSVYGPNKIDENFFKNLKTSITELGNYPIIIGGDWNCTISKDPIEDNIDCLNMQNIPNVRHSNLVEELSTSLSLMDPYRGLFPLRRDFTYVNKAVGRKNRSRIDFFLVSIDLFPSISECDIMPGLQSSLFDHKAIILSFYPRVKIKSNKITISPAILNDDDIRIVVETAVIECYCHHIDTNAVRNFNKIESLMNIGRIWNYLRLAGPAIELGEDDKLHNRLVYLEDIRIILLRFNVNELQEMPLIVSNDLFMETLLLCVKNEVCSYQNFIFKKLAERKKYLIGEINALKNLNNVPCERQHFLEKELNTVFENEILSKLEKSSLFDYLHNEKISPIFLKLAQCSTSEARLEDINKDDGTRFFSDQERNEYIVKYYENIYNPVADVINDQMSIEEFLGPVICNNRIVTDSKLTQIEIERLDSPLNIGELDQAILDCKSRTAGGPDGIGNAFLKKFWDLIRIPLFKYATHCLERGQLSSTFAGGSIRLIPKKGDSSKIKNWRPISLLNCSYKIISIAINNRLKTVEDRIMSRAQKGFTSSRYIQEVLINVIENIAKSNAYNLSTSIVAIDEAKAFDSLSHAFMEKVWNFFNFGPVFKTMLKTLTGNRSSCIILGNGNYSRSFTVKSGTFQGDPPSPLIFNFNQQILLFKLELDNSFSSMFFAFTIPRPIFEAVAPFQNESNRETYNTDGFADDTTVLANTDYASLSSLKNILVRFGQLSGLKCNVEKTSIMPVGNRNALGADVRNLGFQVVDKFTLLGLEITHDLQMLDKVHDITISKVRKVANFWSRFRLSLPGRLGIAKTLMLSQISYLGSILTPTSNQLKTLNDIVLGFVKGNLTISKERLTLAPEEGGVGMIDLTDFIIAQQSCWIKKAYFCSRDNWGYDLKILSNGNCFTVAKENIDPVYNPILFNIVSSFEKFQCAFLTTNDNYKWGLLLNNPLIKRGRFDNSKLNANFFAQNPPLDMRKVAKLTFRDVFRDGNMRSLWEINTDLDLGLNLITYMRLGQACLNFFNSLKVGRNNNNSTISLWNFLKSFKKGSKQLRNILSLDRKGGIKICERRHVITFCRVTEINNPDPIFVKKINENWATYAYPNKLREFIFKFNSNILGINTRVANFVQHVSRACTFCIRNNNLPAHEESFLHLFFFCPTTHNWLLKFELEYYPELVFNNIEERKAFWFLHYRASGDWNFFLSSSLWIFKFLIWENKLKKNLPSFNSMKIDFEIMVKNLLLVSGQAKIDIKKNNYAICRSLGHGGGP